VKRAPGPPTAPEKPRQPGRIRAVFLAVVVHAAFFALIVFGVTWQSRREAPVQVELWDKLPPAPKSQAIEPEPPKPQPEPPKVEPPKPEPAKPEPSKPEVKPQPPKPDPAVVQKIEREKREKLEKEKREKEEAAKKKAEDDKKHREEDRAKREAQKAREDAAQLRKKEADAYVDRIRAKIRARANVPDTVVGNPDVTFLVRVLPGGEVLDVTVTKKSGNPTYDAAIERGIRSASPLPVPPASSELFPQFRELTLNIRHER
jgi:colicin import membrane protein